MTKQILWMPVGKEMEVKNGRPTGRELIVTYGMGRGKNYTKIKARKKKEQNDGTASDTEVAVDLGSDTRPSSLP